MDLSKKIEKKAKERIGVLRSFVAFRPRFEKLNKKGITTKSFCEKYDFVPSIVCKQLKGKLGGSKEYCDRMRKSLKAEGV